MDIMEVPGVSVTWVISVSATVLLLTYFWFSRRNPKLPPSPLRAWPIVGNLLQLDRDPREQFAKFRKQCGDIFSLYLGPKHAVVLNGLDIMKEAVIKQGDYFSDRAVHFFDIAIDGVNKGIFSSNGANWKKQKVLSTSVLRNVGSGGNGLAEKIQEEANHFMELLESFKGESMDIQPFTAASISNILCSIVFGQRFEYHGKDIQRILEIVKYSLIANPGLSVLTYIPWVRFLPGDRFCLKIIEKSISELYDIFDRIQLKENDDVDEEHGDFIAVYLQEIKLKDMTGDNTYLDKANLLRLIVDLYLAGTETTTNSLDWIYLYLVNYPDVQEKIFLEIKNCVGLDRTPDLRDRSKLKYLMATILEVQRLASVVTLSLPRVVSRDINLGGYHIPCGTDVILNYGAILHDPALWGEDADRFKPERFISNEGRLVSPEAWIPFSLGRRVCLGKNLAMMQLFLFVANILQRFQILPADPKEMPAIKGRFGITHIPLVYKIKFVSRRSTL